MRLPAKERLPLHAAAATQHQRRQPKKMTDDDGDDDTMEGRLAHILESDAMDTVDLWLTIVACLAAI